MKLTYSPHPYQWHDGNQHHVGVMVLDSHNDTIWHPDDPDVVLMAHSHTRELEFVRYGDLKPYPSEPITQPTNNGSGY